MRIEHAGSFLVENVQKVMVFLGTELRSTDALEIAEWAFAVTSERASWKTSVPSILQMQANAATLTRVILGALSFRVTSQGSEIGVAREAEARKGRDVGDELGACGVVLNKILPNTQSIDVL